MPHATKDTTTTLNYHGGVKNFTIGTAGDKRRQHTPVPVTIRDIRGSDEPIRLDIHGFQLVERESPEKLFDDDDRIKSVYYPDCVDLIKSVTGATSVLVKSHIVRRQSWQTAFEAEKDLPDHARSKGPSTAQFVHVDASYDGARDQFRESFPDVKIDTCRHAIINVWRPIQRPVTRSALAMCDARSIAEEDLVEVTAHFLPDNLEEDQGPQASKASQKAYKYRPPFGVWELQPPTNETEQPHKWFYASSMKPDEALLLKIFDSKETDGVARRSPHTAFTSPDDHGPDRQSLEVRCYVTWEDQPTK